MIGAGGVDGWGWWMVGAGGVDGWGWWCRWLGLVV